MLQQNDTLNAILEEARKMIEERGEAGLRVAELADRCNVAVGLLYHYFKDRQALIAEVRARQFIEIVDTDITRVSDDLTPQTTVEGLVVMAVESFGASLTDTLRRSNRWKRVAILAATEHNERLRERVSEEQTRASATLAELLADAQSKGIVRDDVDPKALALLIEAVPLGTVLADLSPESSPAQEDWMKVIDLVLRTFAPQP